MSQAGVANNQSQKKWSRLKEIKLDSLEALGLPSKGDDRLLSHQAQEEYYAQIIDRYLRLQDASVQDEARLNNAFSSLSIHGVGAVGQSDLEKDPLKIPETNLIAITVSAMKEFEILIAAMRKLREAFVASARSDTFALSASIFMIRATILTGYWESYHPALLRLLRHLLPANLPSRIPSETQQEFVGYFILDLACRQRDLGRAFHVRHYYNYKNENVSGVLRAIVSGDWYSYWRLRGELDKFQKQLCEWEDERMRACALDSLGASYLSVVKSYVEEAAGRKWSREELGKVKPDWEIEGDKVIIRRVKRK